MLTAVGIRCADHVTPLYPQKLALTSTGGGRSVGIVRSRTKATELVISFVMSVRMKQLGCQETDFHSIWYFGIFSQNCRENSRFIKI